MTPSSKEQAFTLVQRAGILRPRDLNGRDIPRQYLHALQQDGRILKLGRGLYAPAGLEMTESHSLAEACKRVPRGVVCLLSALRFHGLTTQLPHEVWLAIDGKARKPTPGTPPMRIVRFSEEPLNFGIEQRKIEGVLVRFYQPAKTVADCFKYRNKIGLDVALEALRDCLKGKKATIDQLWTAAKMCRVSNIMRPYMEALT